MTILALGADWLAVESDGTAELDAALGAADAADETALDAGDVAVGFWVCDRPNGGVESPAWCHGQVVLDDPANQSDRDGRARAIRSAFWGVGFEFWFAGADVCADGVAK